MPKLRRDGRTVIAAGREQPRGEQADLPGASHAKIVSAFSPSNSLVESTGSTPMSGSFSGADEAD
jgi:hypothetical protein